MIHPLQAVHSVRLNAYKDMHSVITKTPLFPVPLSHGPHVIHHGNPAMEDLICYPSKLLKRDLSIGVLKLSLTNVNILGP